MAKQISVNVDVNSTPHSQIYGSQDYRKNTLINDYGQFESFSSVCDLNNDAKYTVGADGLIFGGPNILGVLKLTGKRFKSGGRKTHGLTWVVVCLYPMDQVKRKMFMYCRWWRIW